MHACEHAHRFRLGIAPHKLTFGLLVYPAVWDWYLTWREKRRGFYTAWEIDMLRVALALTREETGWMRQNPELAAGLSPIRDLVSRHDIEMAKRDWPAACDAFHKHGVGRVREIQRVARVHRDPFEPILPIFEPDSPLAEYGRFPPQDKAALAAQILNRVWEAA